MPLLVSPGVRRASRTVASRLGRVARLATTPLLPADYLGLVAPLTLGADLRGRIVGRRRETRDAVTLVIRPGRGWRGHVPGQYVRIGVDVDGVRCWRAYSLTSHVDDARGLIAITVKKIPGGVVSAYLVDEVPLGTLVMLDQAAGDFVLPARSTRPALFLTAGSGITPVMGMLRNHADRLRDAVVLHSAPSAADVVFGAELRDLPAGGGPRVVERHTDIDGMLDLADLDALVPDWRERETWACGPAGLLDAAHELWEQHGLSAHLHTERFRPALAATGEGGEVTFGRSGVVVDAPGTRPLLDSGEDAGVLMPSGCRMGICFGCAVPLREGTVRDLRNGSVISAAPGDGVIVQTCITAPAGPCQIDL